MTTEELKKFWQSEEDCAFIKGWDFSHIDGRYEETDCLPWDYKAIIRSVLKDDMKLLDYDTGGGENQKSGRETWSFGTDTIRILKK